MLCFNRHVHSTLILWLYSGYIVFIHDNKVDKFIISKRIPVFTFTFLWKTFQLKSLHFLGNRLFVEL